MKALALAMLCLLACQAGLTQPKPTTATRVVHRLALVIGNGTYGKSYWTDLNSPEKDAKDVAALLSSSGYAVTSARNLSGKQLHSAIHDFEAKVAAVKSDVFHRDANTTEPIVVVVFYSGHGFSEQSATYLVGTDAKGKYVEDMQPYVYNVTQFLTSLASDDDISTLVFGMFDACRQEISLPHKPNAAYKSKGAGMTQSALQAMTGKGVLTVFGASQGRPSYDGIDRNHNSLFTDALLKVAAEDREKSKTLEEFAEEVRRKTIDMSTKRQDSPHQVPATEKDIEWIDEPFIPGPAPASSPALPALYTYTTIASSSDAASAAPTRDDASSRHLAEEFNDASKYGRGWIWVGDLLPPGGVLRWHRLNIAATGIDGGSTVAEILESSAPSVSGSSGAIIVRDGYPGDCSQYPECRKNLGGLSSKTPIAFTGKQREHGNQVWAEVVFRKGSLFPATPNNPRARREHQ